jgi:hypothetical protein
VSHPEKLGSFFEAVTRAQVGVNDVRTVQRHAIVDRGRLDILDGHVDFVNRPVDLTPDRLPSPTIIEIVPRSAQITERVHVGRMRPGSLLCHRRYGRDDCD